MFLGLGIEIGGTKLQLGVGAGDGSPLVDCRRCDVDPQQGAAGILRQIEAEASSLAQRYPVQGVGIGFGGPIDSLSGQVLKSHQITGWENLPLAAWCGQLLSVPVAVGNDCDVAALAEAHFGAGSGFSTVFYVTVGTGIGGGLVCNGRLHGRGRPAAAEIGHLRPGVHCDDPEATVEAVASGWGIVAMTQARISGQISRPLDALRSGRRPLDTRSVRQRLEDADLADEEFSSDLFNRCEGDLDKLTARLVAQAAAEGNEVAREVLQHAWQTLGWAIAQTITLLAPDVVVVGGGVSLIGNAGFFVPLRGHVERFVFPPLRNSYQLMPAALGESVVVQGALVLARQQALADRDFVESQLLRPNIPGG